MQAVKARHGALVQTQMNLFRLAGDLTHLLSFVVLLLKIQATKSCSGELLS